MWRWLHSLPRAVRQQFHGSGVSAGVHVEEHHEVDVNKESRCRWKFHCRQKDRSDKEKNDKQSSKPDSNEFWRSVQNQQAFVDAVGLGGVVALGFEVGRHKCPTYCQLEKKAREKLFPSTVVHALPTLKSSASSTKSVERQPPVCEREKTKIFLEQEDTVETIETFETTETSDDVAKTVANENPPEVESLEDAFKQFEEICTKYTAVGKGIMGSQEAQKHNYKSAALLWEESSQLGHAKSRFNLAVCYETGKGVKKDLKEAFRLYKLAAEDLHPQAMYNLGMMYIDGTTHTPADTQKGIELITLAADFGLAEAQCYLGIYYSSEENENEKKAVHYLTLSANQKNIEAEYSLALCYQHGYGVEENLCKAASLFQRAANCRHPDAMYSLAIFFRDGLGGLPKDVDYGEELMHKAADSGSEEAIDEIQKSVKESEVADFKDNVQYLHGCVSSPCLTDLLRKNMITVNSKLVCDPVTDEGTLSQLFTQLLIPRGFTMKPSVTKIQESRTPSPTRDIDTNVKRRKDAKSESLMLHYDDFGDEAIDTPMSCAALQRRTSTMPDLSVIPCL